MREGGVGNRAATRGRRSAPFLPSRNAQCGVARHPYQNFSKLGRRSAPFLPTSVVAGPQKVFKHALRLEQQWLRTFEEKLWLDGVCPTPGGRLGSKMNDYE